MPSDRFLKTMNAAHRVVLTLTRGRIGYAAGDMPVLELTTTGRRTGEPRTVLLTAPVAEDGRYVIVASRGGDDRNPAWFLNLRADPAVRVAVQGGPVQPMRAEIVGPEERPELWQRISGRYRNYAGYQKRTDREIPLVRLVPA